VEGVKLQHMSKAELVEELQRYQSREALFMPPGELLISVTMNGAMTTTGWNVARRNTQVFLT